LGRYIQTPIFLAYWRYSSSVLYNNSKRFQIQNSPVK
jgi:hypothetical protein